VKLQHVIAFPNGFEFQVVAHFRNDGDLAIWDPMHGLAGLRGKPGAKHGELSDEHLRLRIEFADGSEGNNLGPPMRAPTGPGPFLQPGGGGASRSKIDATFWVWPLPQPGPLAFVCEWPKYGIPPTRHEVDSQLIREAARRAIQLWPEEPTNG